MKTIYRFVLASFALMACSPTQPLNVVYKPGSTHAERLTAFDQCDFAAIQAIPRAMATQVSGGYSNPGTLQCNTYGGITTCNQVGAINIPATATTYDANTEIRSRYINRCLEAAGYSVLSRPPCRTDTEIRAMEAFRDEQPDASQITCAIPFRS